MEASTEPFRIVLDQPESTYLAGRVIKGTVHLNLQKRTKIRAIKIQITGKGKCKWMEILRKSSNNESARSLFYSSKEIYTHDEISLDAFEPRGIELSPGEHQFEFEMRLPWNLPSSFKGNYGAIKYKLHATVQRPWTFNLRRTIPLTIVKHMPLPLYLRVNPTSLEKQITKTISLLGTRPITMHAVLPEDFVVRGDPLRICVTVTNNSTTTVEKLRFTVLQFVWYYSHVPLRIQKMECLQIVKKETGAIQKKSERAFAHELLLPATAQPTDDELSGVINISYELRVEAVLRGFFKNLVLNLPFKVYSQESDVAGVPVSVCMHTTVQVAVGNPFEPQSLPAQSTHVSHPSLGAAPTYPSLDSSLGSPSHSSMYSSESSSINSTTSESSAATLSPAVGGTVLSYASGSSSQYNSPSARASVCSNSNVPYMPYSSSPLMVNSYPPGYGAATHGASADSPQYTLIRPQRGTSPRERSPFPPLTMEETIIRNILFNGSSQRFSHPPPPGANEPPPSYDELFGNATAPLPGTPK